MGYYSAFSGSSLPTFRDKIPVTSARLKNPSLDLLKFEDGKKNSSLDFLTLEDGTDRLSRNVGNELPLNAE